MIPKTNIGLALINFIFLTLFFSCSGPKYTQENWPDNRIVFGQGGGFAGSVKEYVLLENGQLFSRSGPETPYEEMTKAKRKSAKAAFELLNSFSIRRKKY